jgi:hypothetical protein
MLNKDKNTCVGVWNDVRDPDKSCQDDWMTHSKRKSEDLIKKEVISMPLPLWHVCRSLYTSLQGVMTAYNMCLNFRHPLWNGQPQRNHWVNHHLKIFLHSTLVVSWGLSTQVSESSSSSGSMTTVHCTRSSSVITAAWELRLPGYSVLQIWKSFS